MSLSNPKVCRIDTFMSGRRVSTSAVIAPPWPRHVRGGNRLYGGGRVFARTQQKTPGGRKRRKRVSGPPKTPNWGRGRRLPAGSAIRRNSVLHQIVMVG